MYRHHQVERNWRLKKRVKGRVSVSRNVASSRKFWARSKRNWRKWNWRRKIELIWRKLFKVKAQKIFSYLISMFHFQSAGPVVDQAAKNLTKEKQVTPTAAFIIPAFRFFMKGWNSGPAAKEKHPTSLRSSIKRDAKKRKSKHSFPKKGEILLTFRPR